MQVKVVKTFDETVKRDHYNRRPDGSRQRAFGSRRDNFKHDYELEEITSVRYQVDEERRRGAGRGGPLLQAEFGKKGSQSEDERLVVFRMEKEAVTAFKSELRSFLQKV